jgi:hypothetical protein
VVKGTALSLELNGVPKLSITNTASCRVVREC